MAMRDALLSEFNQEMTNTRRMLERVPDNRLDFQPHAKSFRMNRLAGHVADLVSWATYTLQTHMLELEVAKFVPFDPSSTQELLSRFDKNVREARAALEESSEDDLYAIWTMKREGQIVMTMPRINVLRSMVMNHLVHHRAQLGVYLRLLDIAVPGMYGPSADEAAAARGSKAA